MPQERALVILACDVSCSDDRTRGVKARAWLEQTHGGPVCRMDELAGGAGARRYWRVEFDDGAHGVLMHAVPEDSELLPPALRVANAEIPFVSMTRLLAAHGVPVPEIFAVDLAQRFVFLEDLGSTHLCDLDADAQSQRLREAVALLARLHASDAGDSLPYQREFDSEWVRFELQTFVRDGARESGGSASQARLAEALDALADAIAELPRVLCLRDFQSQNLMIDAAGRLRVLDYQDALLAPAELDLAALLWDSYVDISDELRDELLRDYARARGVELDPDALALLVVQRKCKDFGRSRYVVARKGDRRYVEAQTRAHDAVTQMLPRLPKDLRFAAEPIHAALGERP